MPDFLHIYLVLEEEMLKEKLKSGIKNLALGLVLSAVAITFFGCGDVEQTSGELTQSGAKTQNAQEQ